MNYILSGFSVSFLFSSIYCLIQRELPKIKRENIKWTLLAAVLDFSYTIVLYTHFIKYIPLGAIGSLINGTDIVLATLCVCLCRKIVPSFLTATGVCLAILGICFTLYPTLYPIFHPDLEMENSTQGIVQSMPPNITLDHFRVNISYENSTMWDLHQTNEMRQHHMRSS